MLLEHEDLDRIRLRASQGRSQRQAEAAGEQRGSAARAGAQQTTSEGRLT
jgi:hypothetical protein